LGIIGSLFIVLLLSNRAHTQGLEEDYSLAVYLQQPHLKAVAQAFTGLRPLLLKGHPVFGYAWNYDTGKASVAAAKAYCQRNVDGTNNDISIRIIRLGNNLVDDNIRLETAIKSYEQHVLNNLHEAYVRTGKREIITELSTILQKTGKYQQSENILIELAHTGEHLARNALAYHWAELQLNLEQALAYADYAVAKDPQFFSYHDTRALVLLRLGRKGEAVQAAALAVELQKHPIALDHYGDILWESGARREAVDAWRQAIMCSIDILFKQRVAQKISTGKNGDIIFE